MDAPSAAAAAAAAGARDTQSTGARQAAAAAASVEERATPRVLDVVAFAGARADEIRSLMEALRSASGNRRVFQRLPRHLRRRAMSHNPHRLPVRLRALAIREMKRMEGSDEHAGPSRKARRKRRFLEDLARRSVRNQWLPTHIWHAKRMFMRNLWGYRLAERTTARGVRAALRAALHQCAVYDASYISCLDFAGTHADIVALLRPFGEPLYSALQLAGVASGSRWGEALLHRPGEFPGGVICPAQFIWRAANIGAAQPDVGRHARLWLFVHAACLAEVASLVTSLLRAARSTPSVTVESRANALARFELRGQQTLTVLGRALQDAVDTNGLWPRLTRAWRSCASLPVRAVLAVRARPANEEARQAFSLRDGRVEPRSDALPAPNIADALLAADWPQSAAASELWDFELHPAVDAKPTTQEERARAEEVKAAGDNKPSKRARTVSELPHSRGDTPLLLLQVPGGTRGVFSGFDLLCPAESSRPLWVSLVRAGARAVALQDRLRVLREQGVPSFPEDFPDSLAGAAYSAYAASRREAAWTRRPPAKRPNFAALVADSPFEPDWASLFNKPSSLPSSDQKDIALPNAALLPRSSGQSTPSETLLPNVALKPPIAPPEWVVVRDAAQLAALLRAPPPAPPQWTPLVLLRAQVHAPRGCLQNNAMLAALSRADLEALAACGGASKWRPPEEPVRTKQQITQRRAPTRPTVGFAACGFLSFMRGHSFATAFVAAWAATTLREAALPESGSDGGSDCARRFHVLWRNPGSTAYHLGVLRFVA